MPIDFRVPIETLYAELDAARAEIVEEPPTGPLKILLGRYDQARKLSPAPTVDGLDPASVSAMCDTLRPLYTAVVEWNLGLLSWMRGRNDDYDGPMITLALNPFEGFFRAIFEQQYPNDPDTVQFELRRIQIFGQDPWENIKKLTGFPETTA